MAKIKDPARLATVFLVVGIVGAVLVAVDLVLVVLEPSLVSAYINLVVGGMLAVVGFKSRRGLRKSEDSREDAD